MSVRVMPYYAGNNHQSVGRMLAVAKLHNEHYVTGGECTFQRYYSFIDLSKFFLNTQVKLPV